LEGLDHRGYTPRFHVILQCLFETLEAFALFLDGTDIFLHDDVLRRGGTHHLRAPAPVGRAPIGPAGVTEIVPEPKGFAAQRGVLEITAGIFTRPGEITHRCIFPCGDLHGREIP
jgi:hypothetical protein